MAYTWKIAFDGSASATYNTAEWEDVWNVFGYVQGPNSVAWYDLMLDAPQLAPGQRHPNILNAFASQFVPERMGTSDGWRVRVTWRIEIDNQQDVSPTSRPPKISADSESVEVPTFYWADGTPTVNTAGQLMTGITRIENHVIFNIEANVGTVPAYFLTSGGRVNSDPVIVAGLAIGAGYLQMRNPRASEDKTDMINGAPETYRTINFSVVYNPNTWISKVPSMGYYQNLLGVLSSCLDGDGEVMTEPAFLDASGAHLSVPVDPNQVYFIEKWAMERVAFAGLPLV